MRRVWDDVQLLLPGNRVKQHLLMGAWRNVIFIADRQKHRHGERAGNGKQIVLHPIFHVRPLEPFDDTRL